MTRILIVSYSMTGTTWAAARELAWQCRADRDAINPVREIGGVARNLWALWDVLTERTPAIDPPRYDPAAYDLVVLATPVWAGRMASPMRSYIMAERERLPKVAFLCTQGGTGAAKVFQSMAALCGKQPVATLALSARDFSAGTDRQKLRAFGERLVAPWPQRQKSEEPRTASTG